MPEHQLVDALTNALSGRSEGMVCAYLFGSHARGKAGVRSDVVHGYQDVDKAIVREVVANRLGDLTAYVVAIRERLTAA